MKHFFKWAAIIHGVMALLFIVGGIGMRVLRYGPHYTSLAFIIWGIVCLWMFVACMFALRNWDFPKDLAFQSQRRKTLIFSICICLPFWVVMGIIVPGSVIDRVNAVEYAIERTPQFEREFQRMVNTLNKDEMNKIYEYTDTKLVLHDWYAASNAIAGALTVRKHINTTNQENSHTHKIKINNKRYIMTLQPHLSRFGWTDFKIPPLGNKKPCQLITPVIIKDTQNNPVSGNYFELARPVFSIAKLNKFDFQFIDNELVLTNFLKKGAGSTGTSRECKKYAEYHAETATKKPVGFGYLMNTPSIIDRYFYYPGITDGISTHRNDRQYFKTFIFTKNWNEYIDEIDLRFAGFFGLY